VQHNEVRDITLLMRAAYESNPVAFQWLLHQMNESIAAKKVTKSNNKPKPSVLITQDSNGHTCMHYALRAQRAEFGATESW
jgi:ankyrin repeat protein